MSLHFVKLCSFCFILLTLVRVMNANDAKSKLKIIRQQIKNKELVPCSNCPKEPAIVFCNVCGNTFCEKCQGNDENPQKRWCICPEKQSENSLFQSQNSTPNNAKHEILEISTFEKLYNFLFGDL